MPPVVLQLLNIWLPYLIVLAAIVVGLSYTRRRTNDMAQLARDSIAAQERTNLLLAEIKAELQKGRA
jgi:hypothetical protein